VPPLLKTFGAGGILFRVYTSVRDSVNESVPECASRKPHLKNRWREFHPILATDVFSRVDVVIRFWSQRSKVKVTPSEGITADDIPLSSIYIWLRTGDEIDW